MIMAKHLLILLVAAGVLACGGSAQAGGYSPRVGKPHLNFTLPSVDGAKAISLSDFRGKKVLLLHFASW